MSNPLIRASDHYVLLEPDSKEKIVSKQEAILWLKNWLSKTETQTIYQNIEDPDQEFFEELLESTYELEIKVGYVIKWFAVRIEPDYLIISLLIALIIFIATSSIFSLFT